MSKKSVNLFLDGLWCSKQVDIKENCHVCYTKLYQWWYNLPTLYILYPQNLCSQMTTTDHAAATATSWSIPQGTATNPSCIMARKI